MEKKYLKMRIRVHLGNIVSIYIVGRHVGIPPSMHQGIRLMLPLFTQFSYTIFH